MTFGFLSKNVEQDFAGTNYLFFKSILTEKKSRKGKNKNKTKKRKIKRKKKIFEMIIEIQNNTWVLYINRYIPLLLRPILFIISNDV